MSHITCYEVLVGRVGTNEEVLISAVSQCFPASHRPSFLLSLLLVCVLIGSRGSRSDKTSRGGQVWLVK